MNFFQLSAEIGILGLDILRKFASSNYYAAATAKLKIDKIRFCTNLTLFTCGPTRRSKVFDSTEFFDCTLTVYIPESDIFGALKVSVKLVSSEDSW